MNVSSYITQKFQSFGISVSEADLLDMGFSSGVEMGDEVNDSNYKNISVSIAKFIPSLLLRATKVVENGFTMEWNLDGLKAYYSYLCKQYGITDEMNADKPKVKFL